MLGVDWHAALIFKNVTWHFGCEVERQMKFVKHTHTDKIALNIPISMGR